MVVVVACSVFTVFGRSRIGMPDGLVMPVVIPGMTAASLSLRALVAGAKRAAFATAHIHRKTVVQTASERHVGHDGDVRDF